MWPSFRCAPDPRHQDLAANIQSCCVFAPSTFATERADSEPGREKVVSSPGRNADLEVLRCSTSNIMHASYTHVRMARRRGDITYVHQCPMRSGCATFSPKAMPAR